MSFASRVHKYTKKKNRKSLPGLWGMSRGPGSQGKVDENVHTDSDDENDITVQGTKRKLDERYAYFAVY